MQSGPAEKQHISTCSVRSIADELQNMFSSRTRKRRRHSDAQIQTCDNKQYVGQQHVIWGFEGLTAVPSRGRAASFPLKKPTFMTDCYTNPFLLL